MIDIWNRMRPRALVWNQQSKGINGAQHTNVDPVLKSRDSVQSWLKIGALLCSCTPMLLSTCVWNGGHTSLGSFLYEVIALFWLSLCSLYLLAFQVRITVSNSGLSYCVLCLSSAIHSLCFVTHIWVLIIDFVSIWTAKHNCRQDWNELNLMQYNLSNWPLSDCCVLIIDLVSIWIAKHHCRQKLNELNLMQ